MQIAHLCATDPLTHCQPPPTPSKGASGFSAMFAGGGRVPMSQLLNVITEVVFEWEENSTLQVTQEFVRNYKLIDEVQTAVANVLTFKQVLEQYDESETFAETLKGDGSKPNEDERRLHAAKRNHAMYRRDGKDGVRPDRLACQPFCGEPPHHRTTT